MKRWHLISGEYPPSTGGVAAFTAMLARGLSAHGRDVVVWTPHRGEQTTGAVVRTLPDAFGPGSCRALQTEVGVSDVVLLQYAPNLLGARGMNLAFCRWLLARSRQGWDVRVFVHEPFFYFGWQRPQLNALAAVQRVMAVLLLKAATMVYLSTPAWESLLRGYSRRDLPMRWVPVTAAIDVVDDPVRVAAFRAHVEGTPALVIGHFSAYPSDVRKPLRAVLRESMQRLPAARALCIGSGSDAFVESVREEPWSPRIAATGALNSGDVSCAIQACDLFVQPYPDGVTTRRTTLLTLLSHGAAVVTTSGALTEPLWAKAGDIFLTAAAGNAVSFAAAVVSLGSDASRRRDVGRAAREAYTREFSPAAALHGLLAADVPSHVAAVALA